MNLIFAALFTALTVPALAMGLSFVKGTEIPLLVAFIPAYLSAGVALLFVSREDSL